MAGERLLRKTTGETLLTTTGEYGTDCDLACEHCSAGTPDAFLVVVSDMVNCECVADSYYEPPFRWYSGTCTIDASFILTNSGPGDYCRWANDSIGSFTWEIYDNEDCTGDPVDSGSGNLAAELLAHAATLRFLIYDTTAGITCHPFLGERAIVDCFTAFTIDNDEVCEFSLMHMSLHACAEGTASFTPKCCS